MTDEDIPPLQSVCTPREDVLSGELAEEQFAASLADIAHEPDKAPDIYLDPTHFFKKTHPTSGLRKLFDRLARRFTGHHAGEYSGTNGVIALDTSFGGGKTHNQIAAHHLAETPNEVPNLDDFITNDDTRTSFQTAVDDGLSVNTAVFVGAHVGATDTRCDYDDPDAPDTQTMWGELAYQLFGTEGYEFLKENDETRNPPGANKLQRLFEDRENPSLILFDEVAAYLEQAAAVSVGPGSDLASQTNVFLMSLLKVTNNTDDLTVVFSIADTAFAEQAEGARNLIDEYNDIAERKKSRITPTDDDEIPEVLRHRLFTDVDTDAAAEVADAYARYYETNAESFPEDLTTPEYRDRLADSYPIHPTVIDTLTEELDSLPSFQRTRGALKLISRGLYHLWQTDDPVEDRHYVRLHDLHPSDANVRSTLLDLFQSVDVDFEAAIKADIYSDRSKANAQVEDDTWLVDGQPPLGTQLTTTILWKSIVIGADGRGTNRRTLRAAVAHPEVDFSHYRGALNNLLGEDLDSACFFLFDEQKLRFKSEANVNKLVEGEAERVQPGVARERLNDTLRSIHGDGELNIVLGPEEPHEVPDELDTVNLCIMDFDTVLIRSDSAATPPEPIQTLYDHTGASSGGATDRRVYRNNIVILAPDAGVIPEARRTASRVFAIEHIQQNLGDKFDLNPTQVDELSQKLETATTDLARVIKRAYRHLYYPTAAGLTHTRIHSVESSDESHIHEVVLNALTDDEKVLLEDAGVHGGRWFKNTVWNDTKDSMTMHAIEKQFAKLRDAPILLSPVPLRETVADLVSEKGWAYWDESTETGYYTPMDDGTDAFARDPAEAENLAAGMDTADVKLTDAHHVYASLDALAADRGDDISWTDTDDTTGGDDTDTSDGGDDTDTTGGGGADPVDDPLPKMVDLLVKQPRHVSRGVEELRTEIDTKIQSLKSNHGYHADDLTTTVESLTITTEGEDAWQHTWFVANKLVSEDTYGGSTEVSFQYTARDGADDQSSTVGFEFDGPADVFVSDFRFSMEPTGLVGDDGERSGEGTVTVEATANGDLPAHEPLLNALADDLDTETDTDFTVKLAASVAIAEGPDAKPEATR